MVFTVSLSFTLLFSAHKLVQALIFCRLYTTRMLPFCARKLYANRRSLTWLCCTCSYELSIWWVVSWVCVSNGNVIHCQWPQLTQAYTDCQPSATHFPLPLSPIFAVGWHILSTTTIGSLKLEVAAKHLKTHLPLSQFACISLCLCLLFDAVAMWLSIFFFFLFQTVCAFAACLSFHDLILLCSLSVCLPGLHLAHCTP